MPKIGPFNHVLSLPSEMQISSKNGKNHKHGSASVGAPKIFKDLTPPGSPKVPRRKYSAQQPAHRHAGLFVDHTTFDAVEVIYQNGTRKIKNNLNPGRITNI